MSRTEAGFTLIEVMIAMTLTALAIMGIIALYITETKASGFSRHTTEAAVLAQDKVETLRTQAAPGVNVALTTDTPNPMNERGLAGGIYTRQFYENVSANYVDIVVTVSWNDDGNGHAVTVRARRSP